MEKKQDHIFSVILLGTSGVGKSTIAFYLEHGYPPPRDIKPTIAFGISHIVVSNTPGTHGIIALVDVGGQKRFLDMRYHERFVRNADGLISVIDASRMDFQQDEKWLDDALALLKEDVPILAIANKQDLTNALPPNLINKELFSKKIIGRTYRLFGTVANDPGGIRSGENINQAVNWLIKEMLKVRNSNNNDFPRSVNIASLG
jgi:small GTP-binding protein